MVELTKRLLWNGIDLGSIFGRIKRKTRKISIKEVLLEIDFREEMRTTWDNKEALQTFSAIPFIRKNTI